MERIGIQSLIDIKVFFQSKYSYIVQFNVHPFRNTSSTYEYVINLSGYIDHHSFLEGGINVLNNHFTGVQNILQVIDWSALKRFVQIGSSDEYGGALAPQHESLRESPISSYAVGKRLRGTRRILGGSLVAAFFCPPRAAPRPSAAAANPEELAPL